MKGGWREQEERVSRPCPRLLNRHGGEERGLGTVTMPQLPSDDASFLDRVAPLPFFEVEKMVVRGFLAWLKYLCMLFFLRI